MTLMNQRYSGLISRLLVAAATTLLTVSMTTGCDDVPPREPDDDDETSGVGQSDAQKCAKAATVCGGSLEDAGECSADAACVAQCIIAANSCDFSDGGLAECAAGCVPSGSMQGQSCSGDASACVGTSSMDVCIDGSYENFSCGDFCSYYGFSNEGCSGDFCSCGEPTDQHCLQGVGVLCSCLEAADSPCTDDEALDAYVACHTGDPEGGTFVSCLGDYNPGSIDACVAAFESCQ